MTSAATSSSFRVHLAGLASDYDRLASENRALRSQLYGGRINCDGEADHGAISEVQIFGAKDWHRVFCPREAGDLRADPEKKTSLRESTLLKETQYSADSVVEAVWADRVFNNEPSHGALPHEGIVPPGPLGVVPTSPLHEPEPSLVWPVEHDSDEDQNAIEEYSGTIHTPLTSRPASKVQGTTQTPPATPCEMIRPDSKNSKQTPDQRVPTCTSDVRSLESKGWKTMLDAGEPVFRHVICREPVFANVEDIKAKVLENMMMPRYNVSDSYKTTGYSQKIARNQYFEYITLFVIALNAIWIAVDTDYNEATLLIQADLVFQVAAHFFCAYFTLELTVRFCAFDKKRNALRDLWFVFDASLVIFMIVETWAINIMLIASSGGKSSGADLGNASVLRIARLLRLTRMARMARLLRAMPELLILVKGIVAATRSVFFTLILLCALLYVWAIAFTQLMQNEGPEIREAHFNGVLDSMHTLWLYATLLDEITELMRVVRPTGIVNMLLLDAFILAAALTVMNMLVGVLCDVVSAVATSERESLSLAAVRSKVETIFYDLNLDQDHNGMISKDEFRQIIENRAAVRAIKDLGVDVIGLVDMADQLFMSEDDDREEIELTFTQFMDILAQLRGGNYATVKDLVQLRYSILKSVRVGRDDPKLPADTNHVVTMSHKTSTFSLLDGVCHSPRASRPPSSEDGDSVQPWAQPSVVKARARSKDQESSSNNVAMFFNSCKEESRSLTK